MVPSSEFGAARIVMGAKVYDNKSGFFKEGSYMIACKEMYKYSPPITRNLRGKCLKNTI